MPPPNTVDKLIGKIMEIHWNWGYCTLFSDKPIFFWVSPISREKWLGVVTEAKFRPGDVISGVIHGFIVQ
jgi:hypothetical protein